MVTTGMFLAFYSSLNGGAIGQLLFQWEQAGVFSYVLPFLLIFALTFGILSTLKLFGENSKMINSIVSISVALMALQFNFVSVFFSEIFPRLGVGLSIVLIFMILLGLFVTDKDGKRTQGFKWFMFVIVLIVIGVILVNTFDSYGWYSGYGVWNWLAYYWPNLLGILAFFAVVIGIITGTGKKKSGGNGLKIVSAD